MDTTPIVPKKRGRPKGSTSAKNAGLSLDTRLKILSKIALDKNGKPTDVINACKEITALLNDRIRNAESESATTVIKFQENEVKLDEKPEIKTKETEIKSFEMDKEINTTTSTTTGQANTQTIVQEEVTKVDVIELNFSFEKDEGDKLDE